MIKTYKYMKWVLHGNFNNWNYNYNIYIWNLPLTRQVNNTINYKLILALKL